MADPPRSDPPPPGSASAAGSPSESTSGAGAPADERAIEPAEALLDEAVGAHQAATRRSVLRSTGVMTLMTALSRVLGLVREQVRAIYLGTGAASDAFGVATMIPNLFRRLLAEGAMTAAFLPIFVEYLRRGDEEETRAFLSRFVTLLTCFVTALCVLGVLLTPWIIHTFFSAEFAEIEGKVALTIALTQLMWPYLFLVTIAAVVQAVLNAHKIFGPSAFTPVLLNLAIIGCGVALATLLPDPSYGLVVGFLVGGVLQVAFQIPYLFRDTPIRFGVDFHWRDSGVRRVLVTMIPGVFAAGVYQVNVFVSQLIASLLEQGSIASLQYSIRLQELVLGLFVVSIAQVILPTLSEHTAERDIPALRDTLGYATRLVAWITLPATAGLVLIGPEVVRLLFQFGEFDADSTAMTAFALVFHALGLLPIALARIYSQAFYADKDLRTPTLIAVVVTATNIALCLLWMGPLRHGGIALAGSVSALVNAALLGAWLRRRFGPAAPAHRRDIWGRVARMALASAAMAAAVYGLELAWPTAAITSRLVLAAWVALACAGALAVYVLACRALRVDELAAIVSAVRRRGRPAA